MIQRTARSRGPDSMHRFSLLSINLEMGKRYVRLSGQGQRIERRDSQQECMKQKEGEQVEELWQSLQELSTLREVNFQELKRRH